MSENHLPQHIQDYFDLLSKEEIEKRLQIAKSKGPRSKTKEIFKGMIWISDDFDEPLECMKDYLP